MSVFEDELEFDMWDGQFEFFGNSYGGDGVEKKDGHEFVQHGVYDETVDLILTPITIAEEPVKSARSAIDKSHISMNLKQQALIEHVTDDVSYTSNEKSNRKS